MTEDYFSGLSSGNLNDCASLDLKARHGAERDALTRTVRTCFENPDDASPSFPLAVLLRAHRDHSTRSIYVLRDSGDFETYALELETEDQAEHTEGATGGGEEGGLRRFAFFTNRKAGDDESSVVIDIMTLPHASGNLGGSIWPSSIALAMSSSGGSGSSSGGSNGLSHYPPGSECLELGSGVGLGGVGVLAGSEAAVVTLSDWDQAAPALVANLEDNARANPQEPFTEGSADRCCDVQLFDWQDALLPQYAASARQYDVVFGADCVYSDQSSIVMGLAAAMRTHLSSSTVNVPEPRGFLWMQNRRNAKTEKGISMCREELSQHGTVTEDAFTLTRLSTNNWSAMITPLTLVTYAPVAPKQHGS